MTTPTNTEMLNNLMGLLEKKDTKPYNNNVNDKMPEFKDVTTGSKFSKLIGEMWKTRNTVNPIVNKTNPYILEV
jgi:hypothetical protein